MPAIKTPATSGIDLGMPLISERLRLRHARSSDIELERSIHSDDSLFVHIPIEPRSADDAPSIIDRRLAARDLSAIGETAMIVYEHIESEEAVGAIQLTPMKLDPPQLAIGWLTLAAHHGRGLTTEAVSAIVNRLFESTSTHRLVADIIDGNEASIRLAERIGFRREAHFRRSLLLRGEWRDEVVYALLSDDWIATQSASR